MTGGGGNGGGGGGEPAGIVSIMAGNLTQTRPRGKRLPEAALARSGVTARGIKPKGRKRARALIKTKPAAANSCIPHFGGLLSRDLWLAWSHYSEWQHRVRKWHHQLENFWKPGFENHLHWNLSHLLFSHECHQAWHGN